MSIALERSPDSSPATSSFAAGGCYGIFEVPGIAGKEMGPLAPLPPAVPGEETCSSSSIGKDSDLSGYGGRSEEGESGEAEVQSRLKGPLETMDALDDSLPMRRGISKFYSGKSKSFASLGNVIKSSMKDLGKPEDPYTRKRKNLLAFSFISEGPIGNKKSCIEDVISKRPTKCSRLLNTSVTSSSSCSNSNSSEEEADPGCLFPPPHPNEESIGVAPRSASSFLSHEKYPFSVRSFSLTNLRGHVSLHSRIPAADKHKSEA